MGTLIWLRLRLPQRPWTPDDPARTVRAAGALAGLPGLTPPTRPPRRRGGEVSGWLDILIGGSSSGVGVQLGGPPEVVAGLPGVVLAEEPWAVLEPCAAPGPPAVSKPPAAPGWGPGSRARRVEPGGSNPAERPPAPGGPMVWISTEWRFPAADGVGLGAPPGDPASALLAAAAQAGPGELAFVQLRLRPATARRLRRAAAFVARARRGDPAPRGLVDRATDLPATVLGGALDVLLGASGGPRPGEPIGGRGLPAFPAVLSGSARPVSARSARCGLATQPPEGAGMGLIDVDAAVFAVEVRTLVGAASVGAAERLAATLGGVLARVPGPGVPGLEPNFACGRRARRIPTTLVSAPDLALLVRLAGAAPDVPGVRCAAAPRHTAPTAAEPATFVLGHAADAAAVGLSLAQLAAHVWVVGPSGSGKTVLLARLVLALERAGIATVVLDPHGDLVRSVLERLPTSPAPGRPAVRLMDFTDPTRLPTLDPLWLADPGDAGGGPKDPRYAEAVAARAAAVAAVFADVWALSRAETPNLLHYLHAALAALAGCGYGCLAMLPDFCRDPRLRTQVLADAEQRTGDPRPAATWRELAAMSALERDRARRALLNKAGDFDATPLLGTVFGTRGPAPGLGGVCDAGESLLVALPGGNVPVGAGVLIGNLLVTELDQRARAREALPPPERRPVVVVADEFHEFAPGALPRAVAAWRKYGVGLVLANQNLAQVRDLGPGVLEALLGNAATLVAVAPGADDALRLAAEFAPVGAAGLGGLHRHESYWRRRGEPGVTWAKLDPPAPALRDAAQMFALAERLRVAGTPLRLSHPWAAPACDSRWVP